MTKLIKILKKKERIMLYSALFFLFFLFLVFYSKVTYPNSIEIKVSNVTDITYSFEIEENDPDVSTILNDCRNKNGTYDKVGCMVMYANKLIDTKKKNPLYDLNEIFEQGTNCIGFSNYYSQISNMVGLNYKPINLWYGDKGHRIGFIIGEDEYCIVNLYDFRCWAW